MFKSEQTVEELRKLKLRLSNHWTKDNINYLLQIYKDSKKSFYIVSDIDKIEKRVFEKGVRERAKSPDSVIKRNIKNFRRPFTAAHSNAFTYADPDLRSKNLGLSSRGVMTGNFDQAIEINTDSA